MDDLELLQRLTESLDLNNALMSGVIMFLGMIFGLGLAFMLFRRM